MKTCVLRVNLAGSQGGILHLRRERMGNRITKNAQANRGINVARDIMPFLKISDRVTLGGLLCHSRRDSTTARVFLRLCKNNVAKPSLLCGRRASSLSDQLCSLVARTRLSTDACASLIPCDD